MTFHSQQSWKSEPCSRKTTNQKWSQRCDFIPYIPQALPGGSQLCPGTTCLQDVGRFRGGVGLISFTCVSLDGGSMEVPPNHPFYVFSNNSMPWKLDIIQLLILLPDSKIQKEIFQWMVCLPIVRFKFRVAGTIWAQSTALVCFNPQSDFESPPEYNQTTTKVQSTVKNNRFSNYIDSNFEIIDSIKDLQS